MCFKKLGETLVFGKDCQTVEVYATFSSLSGTPQKITERRLGNILQIIDDNEDHVLIIQVIPFGCQEQVDLLYSNLAGKYKVCDYYNIKGGEILSSLTLLSADIAVVNPHTIDVASRFDSIRQSMVIFDTVASRAEISSADAFNTGKQITWLLDAPGIPIEIYAKKWI